MQPLAPEAKEYFKLSGWIYWGWIILIAMILLVLVALIVDFLPWWTSGLLWGLISIFSAWFVVFFFPEKSFERTRWCFDEQGLYIHKGVWWHSEYAVPRSRIQHIDVTQGPLQRKYQLARLVLHTAGTHNASIELEGLNYSQALEIRDALLEQDLGDAV